VLAMALREAVTNVLRHASATRVEVELSRRDGGLCLTISDDGRGGVATQGNGLLGMRERLATVGGLLEIDSMPGAGTRLLLRLPAAAIEGPKP
jgi:two-component system sensor histidine kinase DesK